MTDLQGGYRIIDIEDGDIFTTLKEVTESETKPLLIKGVNGTTDHFATVSDLKIITDDNGDISEIDVPLGELSYNSSTGKHTQYVARVTPSSFTTEEVEVTGGGISKITYQDIINTMRPTETYDETVIINTDNITKTFGNIFTQSIGNKSKTVKVVDTEGNDMSSRDGSDTYSSSLYPYYYNTILNELDSKYNGYSWLHLKFLEKILHLHMYLALGIDEGVYFINYLMGGFSEYPAWYTWRDYDVSTGVESKSYTINELLKHDNAGTDETTIYLPSNFNVYKWVFKVAVGSYDMQYTKLVKSDKVSIDSPLYIATINTTVESLDDEFLTFTKVS
jgi:hypothetical protein